MSRGLVTPVIVALADSIVRSLPLLSKRQILDHARDEHLFLYSIYVLESSSSNRLTYFLPPLVSFCVRCFEMGG